MEVNLDTLLERDTHGKLYAECIRGKDSDKYSMRVRSAVSKQYAITHSESSPEVEYAIRTVSNELFNDYASSPGWYTSGILPDYKSTEWGGKIPIAPTPFLTDTIPFHLNSVSNYLRDNPQLSVSTEGRVKMDEAFRIYKKVQAHKNLPDKEKHRLMSSAYKLMGDATGNDAFSRASEVEHYLDQISYPVEGKGAGRDWTDMIGMYQASEFLGKNNYHISGYDYDQGNLYLAEHYDIDWLSEAEQDRKNALSDEGLLNQYF